MVTPFLIEQRGADGRWFIRGSEKFEHDARYHARRYAEEDCTTTVVTDNHNHVVATFFKAAAS